MINRTTGNYNEPRIEVEANGGSITLAFFKKSPNQPRPTMNFHSFNRHGLGYSAFIVEGDKRKDFNKDTYIEHIAKTTWINIDDKVALIDFINQHTQ